MEVFKRTDWANI